MQSARVFLVSIALASMIIIGGGRAARGNDCLIAAVDVTGEDGLAISSYCSNCNIGVSVCTGYSYHGCRWYGIYVCQKGPNGSDSATEGLGE